MFLIGRPKAVSRARGNWSMHEPSAMSQSKEIPRIFDRDVQFVSSESCGVGTSRRIQGSILGSSR